MTLVRTAHARWRMLDIRYLDESITHSPKVEYRVRPIRLLRRLPPIRIPAECFMRK